MSTAIRCLCCIAFILPSTSFAQTPTDTEAKKTDISGTYAQLTVTTVSSKIPIMGRIVNATKTFSKVTLTQDKSGKLTMKENVCSIQIKSTSNKVKTTIPKAFQRAVSGQIRYGQLKTKNNISTVHFPKKVSVFGAKLKNPATDTLPDDEDDKRVFDADKDGKPGLTVRVKGLIDGEIYLVTRGWNEMRATLPANPSKDRINGYVRWGNNQNIVDASSIFLKFQPNSKADTSPSRNYFRWRHIPATTSCSDILKNWKKLLR